MNLAISVVYTGGAKVFCGCRVRNWKKSKRGLVYAFCPDCQRIMIHKHSSNKEPMIGKGE